MAATSNRARQEGGGYNSFPGSGFVAATANQTIADPSSHRSAIPKMKKAREA